MGGRGELGMLCVAAGRVISMPIDVTDETFQTEVIDRSASTAVVLDLWAPWCGPCKTLGPILEKVVDETGGQAVLVKVDIDENPGIAQAFRVQSIPMVVGFKDGQPVDAFMGAQGEHEVREFVDRLLPTQEESTLTELIAAGDEASLRQALEMEPGNEEAIVALADLLVDAGAPDEALALLNRIPESDATRVVAAKARVGVVSDDDHDATLASLLDQVKTDDDARQKFVDILELMGPDDPRAAGYRKQLTARLF
jgi:putative thioredoxin